MSDGGVTLVTYLWHYLLARMIYDQLLRPLSHGHATVAVLVACVGATSFLIGRWTGRRSGLRADGWVTQRRRV